MKGSHDRIRELFSGEGGVFFIAEAGCNYEGDFARAADEDGVVVANGEFAWDDFGSWTALGRHLKHDPEGNAAVADFIHVDGARNIIFDARMKQRTPIAVVGLRDAILVETDDAVLLAHKSQAQRVKDLVKKLAEHPKLKKLV